MTANNEKQAGTLPTSNIPKLRKAADFKSMYINWVQPSFTSFDIALLIGQAASNERQSPTEPATSEVELIGRLLFHPAEAKLAAGLLMQAVAIYEKQFGTLPDPNAMPNESDANSTGSI